MNNRFMPGPFVMIPSGAAKIMTVQEAHILQFVWSLCLEGARGYPTGQRKGQTWVQVSTQQIADALGFWSLRTIKKYVDDLVASELLLSASFKGTGRTNWLSPNYPEIERRMALTESEALGNPRTILPDENSADPAPCIGQSSHHVLGNPRTIDSAAPAPCIVQDLHSPLYRSLDPLDPVDVVDGARENSEPEPTPLPTTIDRSEIERKRKELDEIEAEKSLDVYLLKMSIFYEVPFPVPNALRVAGDVLGIVGVDSARPYIREKMAEYAQRGFDSRLTARFLVQDAAEWKQKQAERVSGRKNETNASGGDLEAHGRPELPHDVAFYDDGVIRPDLERILSKSNEYYRTDDFLKVLFRRFVGQEEQIMDWLKARGLR